MHSDRTNKRRVRLIPYMVTVGAGVGMATAACAMPAEEIADPAPDATVAPMTGSTPALATDGVVDEPATDTEPLEAEIPPATLDTDGDGNMDAWDRDGDERADAWDTDGDGMPDLLDDDGDGVPD